MGADIPKQYLQLRGRAVIAHTLERLLSHGSLRGVVVALAADDPWWPQLGMDEHPDLACVVGGAERCHSVLNGLAALCDRGHADGWVLVHDAVRPCVRADDISALIAGGRDHPVGAVLGIQAKDTMKRSDTRGQVTATVDRQHLWHAYTPQMFRIGELKAAIEQALTGGVVVTDEAMAMELIGCQPCMIEGHADNVKLTASEDLALAEFILSCQEAEK